MCRAEKSWHSWVTPRLVAGIWGQSNKWGYSLLRAAIKFAECRTHARPTSRRLIALGITACLALPCIVSAIGANHRANDGELVHHLRHARKQLANSSARDVGRDFLELTANLLGRIGLHIPHVLMRGSARKKDIDDGLVRPFGALLFLGLQDLRQRQAAHGQPADFQETPPRNPVAELIFFSKNCNHGKQARLYLVIRLGTLSYYSRFYTIFYGKSPFQWAYLSTLYSRPSCI